MFYTKLSVVTMLALVLVVLLSACDNKGTEGDLAQSSQGQNAQPDQSGDEEFEQTIVKNPALKAEISLLNSEMAARNLTEADTANILALSKDPVEIYYAKGFAWLVKNNEYEHLNHPLTFLDWYVRTGEENFCAPHELGHIAAYIEKGDIPLAEETFAVFKQKMPLWAERQEINRQKYPQYYQGLGELKEWMNTAAGMLDKKDYGEETVKLLEKIDEKSIC
ncbi:MAG TPA: hypothetical protein VI934_03205 [Candidatus Nanoarchaeia archaeon]|nr:hypothetical protein [Candidatus Nanoarchaeia archaeon]